MTVQAVSNGQIRADAKSVGAKHWREMLIEFTFWTALAVASILLAGNVKAATNEQQPLQFHVTVWAPLGADQTAINEAADEVRVNLASRGLVPVAWVFSPTCKYDEPRFGLSVVMVRYVVDATVAATPAPLSDR